MTKTNAKNIIYTEMSEEDQKQFRDWVRSVLKMHETKITFTKKDGTDRKMLCTLKEDKIPSEKTPKDTEKSRIKSEESIPVFDLEKEDWRSFRFDSVKKIEFTL